MYHLSLNLIASTGEHAHHVLLNAFSIAYQLHGSGGLRRSPIINIEDSRESGGVPGEIS